MLTTKRPHKPPPATMAHLNELLDEALADTFPASDPVAIAIELAPFDHGTAPGVEADAPPRRVTPGTFSG